ncbi:MAG: cupin domain-containing protein [bacterium]
MIGCTQKKETDVLKVVKKDQLNAFVKKSWGHEEWIVNNEKYCGKKLVFNQGHHCSMHFHKIKEETFYLLYGKMLVELEQEDGSIAKRVITSGDVQHITPGLPHRMTALVDSAIIEFSTFHMDSDSYRKSPSGKIDVSTLEL